MNGIRTFKVRKYSFLKHADGQWEHFPSRNDISLTVVNRDTVKIIWKSSVLEEIHLQLHDVQAYSKSPSIGFKYSTFGDATFKRFQISFATPQEHAICLSYLTTECALSVSDSGNNTMARQHTALPMSQQLYFPESQFAMPMTPVQPTATPFPQQQHIFPLSQTTLSQPVLSQPTLHSMTPHVSFRTDSKQIDYLSQILDPVKDNDSRSVDSRGISIEDLNAMSDMEISGLLKEKIKDVNFINFVERIESCLKGLQEYQGY